MTEESVPVVESAPVAPSAPVTEVQPAPVTATPPPVVYDKDGKPVKAPKICSVKDMENQAKKIAEATQQAATLTRTAEKLRASAVALRAQALKATRSVQALNAMADAADWAAAQLEQQAVALVQKAGELTCAPPIVGGGRF